MAKKIHRGSAPASPNSASSYPSPGLAGQDQPAVGRRKAITDTELFNRWTEIRNWLEEMWGDVGWSLQHIKKPEDVIRVFRLLDSGGTAATSVRLFACLVRLSYTSVTPQQLRDSRRHHSEAVDRRFKLSPQCEIQQTLVSQAETALRQAVELVSTAEHEAEQRSHIKTLALVKNELQERKERLAELQTAYDRAENEMMTLGDTLEDEEAAFARAEVVRFVKSKRYAVTPKKIADAIAGLPYMVWRQSVRRCSRFDDQVKDSRIPSVFYEAFEFFQDLFKGRKPRSADAALRSLRAAILKRSKKRERVQRYCKEYWPFLKEAVEQCVVPTTLTPQFPYNLTASFRNSSVVKPRTELERVIMAASDRFPE